MNQPRDRQQERPAEVESLTSTEALALTWALALATSQFFLALRSSSTAALHAFDAGQYFVVAFITCALCEAWRRWGPRNHRASLACLALSMSVCTWLATTPDFAGFAERNSIIVPPYLSQPIATTLSTSAPSLAWWFARRFSTGVGKALVGLSALVILGLNFVILPHDYQGMHLQMLLCAVLMSTGALTGISRSLRIFAGLHLARTSPRTSLALALSLTCAFFLATPSMRVRSLWDQNGLPFLATTWRSIRPEAPQQSSFMPSADWGEWYRDRSHVSSIPTTRQAARIESPIVLVVSIDALRADVVAGLHGAKIPTLTRLRDESTWFENAYAPGTLTKVSLTSLFMGKHFSQQYWSKDKRGILLPSSDDTQRFPELLNKAGVKTVNFQTVNWLRSHNGHVKGFAEEKYIPYPASKSYYTPAKALLNKLLRRFEKTDSTPHLFFTHLTDPHAPYNSGKNRGSEFARYLSEIEVLDKQLSRLAKALDASPFRERVILVVTADHGEAFGEHGAKHHGTTLYEEELRIPLLIRMPDRKGRKIAQAVSLLDLGPTVLDLFGQATPGYFMGQSLVPFLEGESPQLTRPIIAEARLKKTLISPNGMKVIYDSRSGNIELYDLNADPTERADLSEDRERLKQSLEQLNAFFEAHTFKKNGYQPPLIR